MPIIGNPLNSVAFLTDSYNGTGAQTVFTMSVAPATSSSILVVITGVTQNPTTYSVVGTTLTFSTAPPSGTANISVRYLGIPASGVTTTAYRTLTEFTATASQTTFTPPSYTVGFLNVYQNGVMLGSADYTASNGTTVVLAVGALVGDLISTESFYVSSVLNALPVTGGTISGNLVVTGTASLGTPLAVTSGGTGVATSTGSGANVLGTSPTLTTPILGTPTSGNLANCTGIPAPAALSTASGSAPSYSARAWVSFNGTGTVAINASGNVSSITDLGVGQYAINMTTAMLDANYSVSLSTSDAGSGGSSTMYAYIADNAVPRTASAFRITSLIANGATFFDAQYLNAEVFR